MKRKCDECGFEADDEEYKFVVYSDVTLCGNCDEALNTIKVSQKGKDLNEMRFM